MRLRPILTIVLIVSVLALSGCESAKERAEKHYLSALSLLADGETDKALDELQTVLELDSFHKEARLLFADTLLARGDVGGAYGQYLGLIELFPDTPDIRLQLAYLAIKRGDWDEAERHGREAARLAPDMAGVPAMEIALDFRNAVIARDLAAQRRIADRAFTLLDREPGNTLALRVVIDHLSSGETPLDALPYVDRALEEQPETFELYSTKLRLLKLAENTKSVGELLQIMFDRFPDRPDVRSALINWYLLQGDKAGAEAVLRRLAGAPTENLEGHLALIQLLQVTDGTASARAELVRLINANEGTPNADLYMALRAEMDFQAGDRKSALAEIEAVIAAAPSSEQTRRIKVMLARMLEASGDQAGARARIEEVLAEDRTMVDALKMRASWSVADDRLGDAVLDLRAALDQSPQDPEILTLMAEAHERDGAPDLAGELMALAVEVSGRAVDTSLRYAEFLQRQGRHEAAEAVLTDARQANPASVPVLVRLADLYLAVQDWPRASEISIALRQIATAEASEAEKALQTALLARQKQVAEGMAFLQAQIGQGSADIRAVAMVVQARVDAGELAEARAYLDAEIARRPTDLQLQLLSAGLHMLSGETAKTEAILRDSIAKDANAVSPVQLLYGLLATSGRAPEATVVLDAALAAEPASAALLGLKAAELERDGDLEAATAIYEALYAEDSGNLVLASKLASLITAHRTDSESLERAYAVARRLRGSDVPAFQDSYGWVQYLRGNLYEALRHLEPAAADLPDEALVQFHLGMVYVALNRPKEARRQLARALELARDSPLPQFETARKTLATLPSAP